MSAKSTTDAPNVHRFSPRYTIWIRQQPHQVQTWRKLSGIEATVTYRNNRFGPADRGKIEYPCCISQPILHHRASKLLSSVSNPKQVGNGHDLHETVFAGAMNCLLPPQLCQPLDQINSRWLTVLFSSETCIATLIVTQIIDG